VEAEEALKRLVGEDQLAPRIELRHARGEQVEQRALRLAKARRVRARSSISSISTA
jgi:hypothetical protein